MADVIIGPKDWANDRLAIEGYIAYTRDALEKLRKAVMHNGDGIVELAEEVERMANTLVTKIKRHKHNDEIDWKDTE